MVAVYALLPGLVAEDHVQAATPRSMCKMLSGRVTIRDSVPKHDFLPLFARFPFPF